MPAAEPNGHPSQAGHTTATLLLLVLAVLAASFSVFVVTTNYIIDDSYIYYRYAKNLFDGHGIVFNPGESVEGYTSFSHIVFPWLAFVFGLDPLHTMQFLGVLAQAFTLWLTYRIGIRLGRTPMQSLIAPLLLATHISPLTFAMSGMPIALFYMLITLSVYLLMGGIETRKKAVYFGLALAAVSLTRFDGFLLVGVIFGFALLIDRKLKVAMPALAVTAGIMLVYNVWRVLYYPTVFPNTYYAKMAFSPQRLGIGIGYMGRMMDTAVYGMMLAVVPFIVAKTSRGVRLLGWVVLAQLCYVMLIGGDWMPYYRFVLAVLPLLVVLTQEGIWCLVDFGRPALRTQWLNRAVLGVAMVGILVANVQPIYAVLFPRGFQLQGVSAKFPAKLNGRYWNRADGVRIAKHIDATLPADWPVALEWAGVIPFHFRQPVVDMFCLNDPKGINRGFATSDTGLKPPASYIAGQRPALVLVVARLYPNEAQARAEITRRLTDPKAPKWVQDMYYPLDDPPHNYRIVVEKVDNLYWPMLLRPDLELPG